MENEKQLSLLLEQPLEMGPPFPAGSRNAVARSVEGALLAMLERPNRSNVVAFPGKPMAVIRQVSKVDLLQRILMRSEFFD